MKTITTLGLVLLFGGAGFIGQAQSVTSQSSQTKIVPVPTPYTAAGKDANSTVWQRTVYELDSSGNPVPRIHSYTELSTGLHFRENGQWLDSQEQIAILPNGTAVATNGQHQAYFPGNIYNGQIKLVTPDGKQLYSQPLCLTYFDGTNTVVIAELTNSIGLVAGNNQVIYPNAFTGFSADLRYTYTKAGFEQDVILNEQPPTPESLGLNAATARLEMLTEFFNPPQPTIQSTLLPAQAGLKLQDQSLNFSTMQMGQGRAFLLGQHDPGAGTLVNKQWLQIQGRQILVEEVPVNAIVPGLAALPLTTMGNSSSKSFPVVSRQLVLPPQRLAKNDPARIQLATMNRPAQGFVLDYQMINSDQTGYTFQGDTTYYISSAFSLYGTNTFEGGAVLKFATNGAISMHPGGSGLLGINWQAGAYRPVIFTAKDDNSVGEGFGTGNPIGYYGGNNGMLSLAVFSPQTALTGLRISYANTALGCFVGTFSFNSLQIVNCFNGFQVSGASVHLGNALFANNKTNYVYLSGGSSTVVAQNATFSGSSLLATGPSGSSLALTNCVLANVTNLTSGVVMLSGGYNGFYNTTNFGSATVTNTFYPFQTVGDGSYYLANGCAFTNAGTTSIDPALLAILKQTTTYPPIVYSNTNISTATTLSPQVQRDTDTPDLGYHYDPLDYAFGQCDLHTNLTITAGTAVGFFHASNYGISLDDGANLTCTGTATAPCWMVTAIMVQEGNGAWSFNGMCNVMFNGSGSGNRPQMNAQFAKWSTDTTTAHFRDNSADGMGNLSDCEFYDGATGAYGMYSLNYTNCLSFRTAHYFYAQIKALNFNIQNSTFYNGFMSINRYSGQPTTVWTIKDTAFDGTGFSMTDNLSGNTNYAAFDYNAYNTNNQSGLTYPYPYTPPSTNRLESIGAHDVFVGTYNWQSSWFGNYYQPTGSPLIDKGDRTADQVGLFHFTTQTNQVKETNSIVDIGYHYVATDQYGNPQDSNDDGIPDYLEDANGNGLVDNGEQPWSLIILAQPVNQTAYVGDNINFSVTAQGLAPISYQWQFNGTNIPGATNATLTLNIIQTNNAGSYSVTVSNAQCSINSSNATLAVLTPAYAVLFGSQTNYLFRGDTTYYIAGALSLYGTNTFEGGAVLKYATNASISCQTNPVIFAGAYRPVIFTAKDDNTVGSLISGSTGNPTNYYAVNTLALPNGGNISLQYMRIAYAQLAISAGGTLSLANMQMVNCQNGVAVNSGQSLGLSLENVLMTGVRTNVNLTALGGSATVNAQNVTFANTPATGDPNYSLIGQGANTNWGINLTNCILANMNFNNVAGVNLSGANNNGFYPGSSTLGSSAYSTVNYPFQSAGAGNYYLTNGSPFLNVGTTNIDPVLLAGLRQKTTYPPVLNYSNITVSVNTTLPPQAQRDTDTPDLGYHYDPLDYLVDNFLITNAVLTLTNGVAVGFYNDTGFIVGDGSSIVSIGSPLQPNWFARYSCVQEQPVTLLGLYGGSPSSGMDINPYHLNTANSGQFSFTKFACPAGGGYHIYHYQNNWTYNNLLVQNCEFWNGLNYFGGFTNSVATLNNNLFWRSSFKATPISAAAKSYLSVTNNLIFGSSVVIGNLGGSGSTNWCFFNNDFDSCGNILYTNKFIANGYNAYLNCTGYLYPTDATDIFSTNSLAYQTGPLGTFYQPTSSSLIDKGSTNANLLGLYQFTTQTNQVKETNSIVDIGYHYVATYANGNPLDSNADGIPDYQEDANGNGVVDNGEMNWSIAILVQPTNQTVVQTSNTTFSVTAAGIAPLNYQWYFNLAPVANATNATLILTNVQANNAGTYYVVVNNSIGSLNSSNAVLTVLMPPTITIQPDDWTVLIGETATFSVAVSGTGPLAYQWYFNSAPVANATNATLIFTNVQTNNAGNYYVVVSNSIGSLNSSNAVLTVLVPPTITIQPNDWTVLMGGTATFNAPVSGTGPFTYQWQFNGANLPNGIITTVAGNGNGGYSGDGGAAANASLNVPGGVAVDASGNLFIADTYNNAIRKVDLNGIITTVVGNGFFGYYSGDGGVATSARLYGPCDVAVDASGNLFIADTGNNRIRKVDINGIITTVAGMGACEGHPGGYSGDGGAATNASLSQPSGVAVDASGNLFIADTWNQVIRKVDTNGIITTRAGNGTKGYSGDGGAATSASLNWPSGVAVDASGNLFIADTDNSVIRKVNPDGVITTMAGNGGEGYSGDGGAATNASLYWPYGVAVDPVGNLLIADTWNQVIRKVDLSGVITTMAGNGTKDYSGDGGAATSASLANPCGVAVDASGNLFIADLGNNRIREVVLGASYPTLTLYNVTSNNAGNYSVIVTSPYGSVTSFNALLTVVVYGNTNGVGLTNILSILAGNDPLNPWIPPSGDTNSTPPNINLSIPANAQQQ